MCALLSVHRVAGRMSVHICIFNAANRQDLELLESQQWGIAIKSNFWGSGIGAQEPGSEATNRYLPF